MSIKNDHHRGAGSSDNGANDPSDLNAGSPAPDPALNVQSLTSLAPGGSETGALAPDNSSTAATSSQATPLEASPPPPVATALQTSTSFVVGAANSNLSWNLQFVAADNPTPAFEAGIEQAAAMLSAAITVASPITINIQVEYNEDGIPSGSADAGPDNGTFVNYSTLRADLLANAPGDPNFNANSLPAGTSIDGQSSIVVWSAEEKALGLEAGNATGLDGTANFSSAIPSDSLVGVGLHELAHALGRIYYSPQPDVFELFRYTSPGTILESEAIPAPPSYFSVNGGTTQLVSYGIDSDPSDFLNSSAPNDPFDEYYTPGSTLQTLTALDLQQLDVLGFDTTGTTPCFLTGTHILTPTGEVLIENLKIGDLVVTASGEKRPIRWIGRRPVDCRRHPDPEAVWPVCIRQGALGAGKPVRDLWLTRGHSLMFDDVLIQAEKLINGVTIVQQPRDRIEVWHIELDSHDIILADGAPAESYLDTGNRAAFLDGDAFLELHPDFEPKHWTKTCLPLVLDGPKLIRAKASIRKVAAQRGYVITTDADPHIMAEGNRVDPIWLTETRLAFVLPTGCLHSTLRSRRFTPVHFHPTSQDGRTLGLAVGRLQIDGSDIAIDNDAALSAGWHNFEQHEDGRCLRWTNGDAALPANARLIVIDIAERGHYWDDRQDNVVPLFSKQMLGTRPGAA